MDNAENNKLHFNIVCSFLEDGKELKEIIKEHFLIYIKDLKNSKNLQE